MLATAVSVGHGGSSKKREFIAFYAVGSIVGACGVGLMLLTARTAVGAEGGFQARVAAATLGVLLVLYSAESIGLRVPYPVLHNYVPRGWRNVVPHRRLGFSYGFGLGIGVGTYSSGPLLYLLLLCSVFVGSSTLVPLVGMSLFGIGRTIPLMLLAPRLNTIEEWGDFQRLVASSQNLILLAGQMALAALGVIVLRTSLI